MARQKNVTQDTLLMIFGMIILAMFIAQGIRLAFFWSLGETEKYIEWLMPGEYTWALAWFVQVGGDSFHLIAHTVVHKRAWLAWLLHIAAFIFNIADGGTNHGSLQASPLTAIAGFNPALAERVEMVIAYGTAFLEQLVVLSLLAFLTYWRMVTIDFGWPGWMRPAWLVGSSPNREAKRPSNHQQPTTPAPQINMQPVRVAANGGNIPGDSRTHSQPRTNGNGRRARQRPPVPMRPGE